MCSSTVMARRCRWTSSAAASLISTRYDEVSVEERRAQLEGSGLDEWRVDLLLGIDEINRAEVYRTPTDTVELLTGHRPRTIHEYIARHRNNSSLAARSV